MLALSAIQTPPSAIAFSIGCLALAVLGVRSLNRYRSIKAPLSRYFATISGVAAAGLFFYSVPFMLFTSSPILKAAFIIGDGFVYLYILGISRILWYMALSKRFAFAYLLVPVAAIAATAWIVGSWHVINSTTTVVDDEIVSSFPDLAAFLQSSLFLLPIFLGAVFLRESVHTQGVRNKIRAISLAVLLILSAFLAMANLILFQGTASPGLSLIYMGVFGLFLISLLVLNFFFVRFKYH